jgi:hypothetical protein
VICPASSESGLIGASANAQSGIERNVLSPAQENPHVFPYLGSPLNDIHYLDSHEVDPTLEEGFRSADSDEEEALGVSQEVPANYQVASLLVHPPETIVVMKSNDASPTWKVACPDYEPPSTIEKRNEAILRRTNGELPSLRGGIHEHDGGFDPLALWLRLYPGNIDNDLERLNASALRSRSTFRHVTIYEWVRFWGLILVALQFNHKGKDCGLIIPQHTAYVKRLVSRSTWSTGAKEWRMFDKMVIDSNTNRSEVMYFSSWGTADESMNTY